MYGGGSVNFLTIFSKTYPPDEENVKSLYPILRGLSSNPANSNAVMNVSRWMRRGVPNEVCYDYLWHSILARGGQRLRFHKKEKREEEPTEEAIKKTFGWTTNEYLQMVDVIRGLGKEFTQKLHFAHGFSERECKKLGINFKRD